MSDSFSIDMAVGMNRLAVSLGKVPVKVLPLTLKVLAKTSADIERDAKMFAPVDTGNLRNSISRELEGLTAEIGPTASYGSYVEFGTSTRGPAAFVGPAFDRHAGTFEQAMGKIVEGLL